MMIGKTRWEREEKVRRERALQRRPKVWFAWRPVTLDDGRVVWLGKVMRFRSCVLDRWHYNTIKKEEPQR